MRLLLGFATFLAVPAFAQTTEIQSARAAAMGGAFRAVGFDNSAIDMNPAAMMQVRKFDFEGGYFRSTDEAPDEYALHVSVADSLTNAVATGIAIEFRRLRLDLPDGTKQTVDVQRYVTAAGIPIIPESLSVGMNGKVISFKNGGRKRNTLTGDFALHARPFRLVGLAAGFDNLVNGGEAEAPRTITGGVALLPAPWFTLAADAFQDLATDPEEDHIGWSAGAQWVPSRSLALRGGVYEPATDPDLRERTWTAGVGLLAETGSIDYCARLTDGDSKTLSHHVTVSVTAF